MEQAFLLCHNISLLFIKKNILFKRSCSYNIKILSEAIFFQFISNSFLFKFYQFSYELNIYLYLTMFKIIPIFTSESKKVNGGMLNKFKFKH